jgi:hypothetical protein
VQRNLKSAFGDRLDEVRAAMEAAAARLSPNELNELNRIGFRLYTVFWPDIPEGIEGWGAKGELSIDGFTSAVEQDLRAQPRQGCGPTPGPGERDSYGFPDAVRVLSKAANQGRCGVDPAAA